MGRTRSSKRVTLQQVADAAGVSRSAASFVMSGRTDQRIAQSTAEKICEIAQELGYRPNLTAKTLRTGTSGTVALISDFIGVTSRANSLVSSAMEALHDRESLLFTVDTRGDSATELRAVQALLDRQVDGVLYASMFTREVHLPDLLSHTPTVLLNCLEDNAGRSSESQNSNNVSENLNGQRDLSVRKVPCVIPDEYQAGRSAIAALLRAGHSTEISFVGCFPEGVTGGAHWNGWQPWALNQRLQGVKDALGEAGLRLLSVYTADEWDCDAGRNIAMRMLASGAGLPTAVVCVNDELAFGLVQVLQLKGVRVPEDISVVSFDGSPWAGASMPALTTLCLPHEELGRKAVEVLFDQRPLSGIAQKVLVPMPMREGQSIAAPRLT